MKKQPKWKADAERKGIRIDKPMQKKVNEQKLDAPKRMGKGDSLNFTYL